MSEVFSAQHPPALRVGGRRLSVSARSRPHAAPVGSPTRANETANADYPRPTSQAEGDEQAQTHPPPHNEEEPPKKEKKRGHGGHDQNRLKESVYHKLDATVPAKDHMAAKHAIGGAGRIGQPMGKSLAV